MDTLLNVLWLNKFAHSNTVGKHVFCFELAWYLSYGPSPVGSLLSSFVRYEPMRNESLQANRMDSSFEKLRHETSPYLLQFVDDVKRHMTIALEWYTCCMQGSSCCECPFRTGLIPSGVSHKQCMSYILQYGTTSAANVRSRRGLIHIQMTN